LPGVGSRLYFWCELALIITVTDDISDVDVNNVIINTSIIHEGQTIAGKPDTSLAIGSAADVFGRVRHVAAPSIAV